ncbi:MAG: EAL domain-containing protein [Acidobacteria bacterium]|nr:EAL domain-containing protein [Acidobacteriota bacterium]
MYNLAVSCLLHRFSFDMLPPWSHIWLLRAPLLLGAVLLVRAYWRRRLRLYLEQQRQLELAVEQRTCELHLEKEKYRAIVDTTKEWIWATDQAGRISYSNPAAQAMLGYSAEELTGQDRLAFVHHEDRRALEHMLPGLVADKCGWTGLVLRWRHKNGRYLYLESNAVPVLDGAGTVTGYRGADRDITERKQAEEALRESEKRYKLAVNGANDGLWDWNLQTGEVYYSPRWKSMLGYEEAEIGSRPDEWFSRVHPEDLGRLKMEIGVHLEGQNQNFQHEHRMCHKDGSYRWMLSRGLAVLDDSGNPLRMAGSQADITARKQAEERLLHDAFHDELTGLPNRNLFLERLERAAIRAQRRDNYQFAVLFLDLDRFKVINDSLGHLVGDQLLVGIARRLQECLRLGDTVARVGGDEFVILLDELQAVHDATQLAERIQREFSRPFNLGGHEVFTSASIGIALNNTSYERPEDILRDADTVMYRAKALGKARHEVFHSGLHAHAVERMRLETDLRKALDRQEFLLYYQPIVARVTGEISSLEALLRWKHPERGLIMPSQFIPVAEETGMILPLGEWALRTACAQNKAWQEAGFAHVRVAVNLSGRQFKQPDFPQMIARTLEETGLQPQHLELELTESIVLNYAPSTLKTLEQLSAMGIRISIDDFGTGYSSLRYLHQFPISALKIDHSFISDIIANPDGAAIAKAIIELGHSLKLSVVAEGVETEEQLDFLSRHQCDEMQGYVFGHPAPPEKTTKLLEGRLFLAPFSGAARRAPLYILR